MGKGMFDYNNDGKLDANERAAEWMFMDEVIMAEEKEDSFTAESLHLESSFGKPRGEVKGLSFMGKQFYDATKDSDGVKILKSLLVIGLCIGGIALPIALDMGDLGMGICMLAGPALSVLILKNT